MLSIKKLNKLSRAYSAFIILLGSFLVSFSFASIFAPVKISSAEEQDLNVNLNGGSYNISVTTSPSLDIDLDTVSVSGAFASVSNELTTVANVPNGYQLYLSVDNNHEGGNRLYLDGDSESGFISPNYGTSTSDELDIDHPATLKANTWGFTNTAANNEAKVYSAVPLLGNGALIDQQDTSGTFHPTVYYAVNVNSNMDAGTYKGKLVYTIIGEDVADNYDIPSISKSSGAMDDAIAITGTLPMAVESAEDLGTVTAKIDNVSCNNQSVSIASGAVTVNCTVPFLSSNGDKTVELYVQKFNKTYTLENGFNYLNLNSITTMQEMTGGICKGTAAGSTIYNLEDTRGRGLAGEGAMDGSGKKTYGVIRALDGNCWMTENFDLYGIEISAEDSDFESGTYTIPTSSTWDGGIYTEPRVHRGTNTNYTDVVYYDWAAAVALQNSSPTAQQNQSICPKGWRLPVNGSASTNKSYTKLMNAYGATSGANLFNPSHSSYVLGFRKLYGWAASEEVSQGSYAHFWSSTPSSVANAYHMRYTNGDFTFNHGDHSKGWGFLVRCVSRD